MPPPSGAPPPRPPAPPQEQPNHQSSPGAIDTTHFTSEMDSIKDSLRGLNDTTRGMQEGYGIPGISEDDRSMDPALVSSTSHGVDSASLRLDPSQIRIQRGFLWKKAADTKKWKKRFFLLKTDLRNATDSFELYYYAKENDQTPKAIIVLDGAEVMAEARNKHDKSVKYEFQLHVAGGQVVELYCDDPNVRKDWVDTLAAVVNAHRKRMQVSAGMSLAAGGATGGLYNIAVTDNQAQFCQAFGPGCGGVCESGVSTTFTAMGKNEFGEDMSAGGLPFTATLENETYLYNLQVIDNDDGTYESTYAISAPGTYSLAIKLNDEYHIFGSPFILKVEAGRSDPKKSAARGDGLVAAKSHETSYFTIESKDSMDNRRESGGDDFEVSVSGPALLKGLQDNGDGTYSCAFEVTATADTVAQVPNAVRINVKLNGQHLKGSPFVPMLEGPEGQWEIVPTSSPPPRGVQGAAPAQPAIVAEELNIYAHGGGGDLSTMPGGGPQMFQMSPDNVRQQFSDDSQQHLDDSMQSPSALFEGSGSNPMNSSFGNNRQQASPKMSLSAPMANMMPPAEASPTGLSGLGGSGGMSKLAMASARAKAARAARQQGAAGGGASASSTPMMEKMREERRERAKMGGSGGRAPAAAAPPADAGMAAPSDLSAEDAHIWSLAIDLMRDQNVLPLFESHSAHLMLVFDAFSTGSGAHHGHTVKTLTLGSSGGQHKGTLQMAIDFDIVPTFLTKKEIKGCYSVVSRMQGAESSATVGLDFAGFIQLLGLLAVQALSKPSFAQLYPTNQAKVGVLLEMWGFSDPIKLQMVIHKA